MAIETPRHEAYACDERHPGQTHDDWITQMVRNLAELNSSEDRSEDAAFIGKITLADPARDYCLYDHPDEPIQCHRPKGHKGSHAQFPREGDFTAGGLMQIDPSDAHKILDNLRNNEEFHIKRDEMNAAVHLSTERVRYSPITSETIAQRERLEKLMQEQGIPQ
jgi:hypothetical protein